MQLLEITFSGDYKIAKNERIVKPEQKQKSEQEMAKRSKSFARIQFFENGFKNEQTGGIYILTKNCIRAELVFGLCAVAARPYPKELNIMNNEPVYIET